ncbi:hypothetical protein GCM10022252_03930 [Streptosporangium oxazolinicum]|uniref:Uncharacterized protein n=1 Tax=Streptosporangium oxazolinicum TaxID=909287 RepID=A0ABP8AA63_9ACTN
MLVKHVGRPGGRPGGGTPPQASLRAAGAGIRPETGPASPCVPEARAPCRNRHERDAYFGMSTVSTM